jgi:hypothetical protein
MPHNGEHCDYGHGSNDNREHGLQPRRTPGFALAFIMRFGPSAVVNLKPPRDAAGPELKRQK